MRALVHNAPFSFELRDVGNPEPGPNDLLIAVQSVGICGSDVHGMTGTTGRRIPPVVMGHEAAGEVVDTGAGAEAWRGKRVTFDSMIYCGSCGPCRAGATNLCESRMVLGVSCDEYRRDGAFAEYVVVPSRIAFELPESVSYDHGAMAEPLSVAVHAVRQAHIAPTDRVLVVGCGIIGLLTIQAVRAAGCGTIIATDLSARRREAALACGADITVQPELLDEQAEVDAAFEAVGATPTVNAAIKLVRRGGRVVLIGNVAPDVSFPLQTVVTREISVLGSCASSGEYPECLDLISSGAVTLDPLITSRIRLDEAGAMFQTLHDSPENHLKVIVKPHS